MKMKQNTSAISNKSLNEFASTGTGKAKMLKHQLPGNNVLTEADQSKLGSRRDRYGVFGGESGATEFDQIVS